MTNPNAEMTQVIAVLYLVPAGTIESRPFHGDLRGARRWASWLRTTTWARDVRVMAGGAGGIEIE